MPNLKAANDRLNAFITILDRPRTLSSHPELDSGSLRKDPGVKPQDESQKPNLPLAGLTYAAKDNFATTGIQTTAGSKILEGWLPPFESTVTQKLHDAGTALVGKTNLDEFAMGSSTEHSAFGVVHNPWDLDKVSGGSSGGSAAAVAARLTDFAIGTDTGGSVRQPAALCGVYGLKPTYGRVSRYGIVPLGSSLDQAGIFSTDVETMAKVLQVISGPDDQDATSVDRPVPEPIIPNSKFQIPDLKIGWVPKVLESEGLQSEIKTALEDARKFYEQQGATFVDLELPHLDYSIAAYYVILPAEASSNLARYDGVHFGPRADAGSLKELYVQTRSHYFGAEPKRRILIGSFVLSAGYTAAYYEQAARVRTLIKRDFDEAYEKVDLILMPTTPTTAFAIGEKQAPLDMYLNDVFTIPANLTGNPALSFPAGFDSAGLPIGLQLIGPNWSEERILQTASAFESAHDYHRREPKP